MNTRLPRISSLPGALALSVLLAFGACGGDADGHAANGGATGPLAGSWNHATDDGSHGMSFEFEAGGDRVMIHGAPRDDGTHPHYEGSYKLDGTRLDVEWQQDGKTVKMSGTVDGGRIELSGDGREVVLEHSEHGAHDGHDH